MQLTSQEIATLRLVFKKISFLEYLKLNELDELIKHMDKRPFRKGEEIIKQGQRGETFYIIASGTVGIFKVKLFGKKKISSLGASSFFGEMALIDDVPRNASVIGDEDGEIYFLPRETFKKVLLVNPRISEMIKQTADYRRAQNKALDTA